jgi:hypothetical protein
MVRNNCGVGKRKIVFQAYFEWLLTVQQPPSALTRASSSPSRAPQRPWVREGIEDIGERQMDTGRSIEPEEYIFGQKAVLRAIEQLPLPLTQARPKRLYLGLRLPGALHGLLQVQQLLPVPLLQLSGVHLSNGTAGHQLRGRMMNDASVDAVTHHVAATLHLSLSVEVYIGSDSSN